VRIFDRIHSGCRVTTPGIFPVFRMTTGGKYTIYGKTEFLMTEIFLVLFF